MDARYDKEGDMDMVYEKIIRGKFVDLKSITLEDAEFSYAIRMEEKNRTVGQPAADLERQKEFIEWQRNEPGDYYFVVWNKKGERVGLIGVYDIRDGVGEVGREVSDGTPMEAMEAKVLLEDFYKDILHLKKVTAVIYTSNERQLSNQKKLGMTMKRIVERNGVECAYFETDVDGTQFQKIRQLLEKIRGQEQ